MRYILLGIGIIVIIAGAGYFGLPVLIEKETAQLRSDVQDVKQRLQTIEDFVKKEDEARQITGLTPDADLQKVIRTINAVSLNVSNLEKSFRKDISGLSKELAQQKQMLEEAIEKQADEVDKLQKETKSLTRNIMFDAAMANVRSQILKVRGDLLYKNIGTAKSEMNLLIDAFEKVKISANEENKKLIDEFQKVLKTAKEEVDSDLPAAMNKIDLLWHEMGKLIRKA